MLHTMKTFAIIGCSVVIIIACVLSLRYHARISAARDEDLRGKLAGVWLRAEDNLPRGVGMPLSLRCTNTVAPDGSFACRSWLSHPDRTNTYQDTGTWHIKDGNLIETVTKDSNQAAVVPRSSSGQIVFTKTNQFVIYWQGTTNTQVWQKISL
jgi:hypothetical protein